MTWRPGLTDMRGGPIDTSKKIEVLLDCMDRETSLLRGTIEDLCKAGESFIAQTADPTKLLVRAEMAERKAELAEFDLRAERQIYVALEAKQSERIQTAEAEIARLTSALQTAEAEVARLTSALQTHLEAKGSKKKTARSKPT